MGRKAWKFNAGARLDQGLSMSFSRGCATKDEAGTAVAADTPRYGRRSILCGAPVITPVSNASANSWNVMATGVDADGSTPVLCLLASTAGKIHIFKSAIVIDGSGNSTYVYSVPLGTSGEQDILANSLDKLDGGAGALGDYNLTPTGGVCYHGRIDLLCRVSFSDAGPTWHTNRVGVVSCNLTDLLGASNTWWRKTWIAPESPGGETSDIANMAVGWALQAWSSPTFDGSAPTTVVIAAADYESDASIKHGGYLYTCVVTRPSTSSGAWTPGVFQQALTFVRPTNVTHCHGGLVIPAADGSAKIIASRGDGHANNAIYVGGIASLAAYSAGSSADGGGSYNSNSGGTGIGAMTIVNGRIGGLTGSPPATDNTNASAARYSAQVFGIQRGPGVDSFIAGADEQHYAIILATSVPTSGGITFSEVFRQHRMHPVAGKVSSSSTKLNTSRLCFQLITRSPTAPIPEVIANVTPQASAYQQDVMCHGAYSPNGVEYGVAWNTREPEQARPGFFGSSIVIGSPTGRGNGVRTIPVPSYLRGRPLLVDAGGPTIVNCLASGSLTLTQSSGMSADNTSELNQTEALPASYTPAPGFGTPIYFASRAADAVNAAVTTATASVGNPCEITTNQPHGLVTGVQVTLAGFNTDTSLNGSWFITVTSDTTFTVPCSVTGGADLVGTVTYSPGAAKFSVRLSTTGLPAVTAGTDSHLLIQFAIHCAKVADWRSSGNDGVGTLDIAPPNSSTDIGSNSCSQGFRFRVRLAGTDFTGYTENVYVAANDGTPHIFTIPVAVSAWAARSANYQVDLYVESTTPALPIKGWLTPIGVYALDHAPCPVAAGATAQATALSITGFSLPTTGFSAYWSGKVPTTPMLEMACAQSHTNTTSTTLTITGITAASPGVVTLAKHGLQNGDTVVISGSNCTPTIDGTRTVANVTTDTFTVGVNTSGTGNAGTVYAPVITRLAGVSTGLDTVADAFAGHRLFGVNSSSGAAFTDYGLAVESSVYISTGVHNLRHASRGGTTVGSYSQVDVVMPGASASAQPLFALANTDRSRIIAVYLDCVDGAIKVRYYNGTAWGSYASTTGYYFTPECPVHVALTYDGAGTLTMYASAGGSAVTSATLSITPDQSMTQLIAGDGSSVSPSEWWGGCVVDSAESSSQQSARLAGVSYVPNQARTRARRNRGARAYASR